MARFSFVVPVAVTSLVALACGGSDPAPILNGGDASASDTGASDTGTSPDSGILFPDAGIGDPKVVDMTFADKCPVTAPCGGDVVGTWDYSEACAEGVWEEAKKFCPTLGIKKQAGTVQGRVVFNGTTVSRAVKLTFTATLNLPQGCLGNTLTCQQVQASLQKNFTTATCASGGGGGCDCDVSTVLAGTGSGGGYTLQGNQIVGADGNKFDYCVKGPSMSYRWVSGPNPERASFTLSKK